MAGTASRRIVLALALWLPVAAGWAQSDIPRVTVTAPAYTMRHGGYLISGAFKVNPRFPYVVYPAQALARGDVLSVHPVHLNDDEYLVLQTCASADCHQARIVRVWDNDGVAGVTPHSEDRVLVPQGNKYFIWLARLPLVSGSDCSDCEGHFTRFRLLSPPMTLIPTGAAASFHRAQLARSSATAIPVARSHHDGVTFVVTFTGGSTILVQRMRAAH